jgi:hypothetical protein
MIGNILKPWSFTNNTEVANATKVNQDFDVAYAAINELITSSNDVAGTKSSLEARLAVSLNEDGTIKASALPVGTYDVRRTRIIDADDDMAADDSVILVDTTAGNVALTLLPAAETNISLTIVNIGLTGNSVIITPDGTDTIMALATYPLDVGGESVRLSPDGVSNWWRSG